MRAAGRGVEVRVLVDGWGAKLYLTRRLERALREGGVQLMKYRPEVAPWQFRTHRLRRLHRKVCHVDCEVAFVGGINIIDDMNTPHQKPPRVDFAVRVAVPGCADRADDAASCGRWSSSCSSSAAKCRFLGPDRHRAGRQPGGEVRDPRQPAVPARHRACVPRRDSHREARDRHRQRLFLSRRPLPARADRRRRSRRQGHASPAGARRVPAAPLRVARALRPAARCRRLDRGVPPLRSCTPRSRSSTTTGRPWAPRTSTRIRCSWRARRTCSCATRISPTSFASSSCP